MVHSIIMYRMRGGWSWCFSICEEGPLKTVLHTLAQTEWASKRLWELLVWFVSLKYPHHIEQKRPSMKWSTNSRNKTHKTRTHQSKRPWDAHKLTGSATKYIHKWRGREGEREKISNINHSSNIFCDSIVFYSILLSSWLTTHTNIERKKSHT